MRNYNDLLYVNIKWGLADTMQEVTPYMSWYKIKKNVKQKTRASLDYVTSIYLMSKKEDEYGKRL